MSDTTEPLAAKEAAMPSTHKKKRCPFCSGEAAYDVAVNKKTGEAKYYVFCRYCGAETSFYETIDEAVAAWNRRAEEGGQP